jgi:ribosomal protein L29
MTTIAFDTLKLARKLEAAGFPQKQAADTTAALAESLGEVSGLATKADLAELRTELKADMAELRAELKADMAELRAELKADMAELKADMAGLRAEIRGELNTHLRWIVGTILAVAALAVAASKLLP